MYDPSSPLYHQFLTPSQFYSLYGPDPAEIAALTTYMQANGLRIQTSDTNTNVAEASGTVAQVQNALNTQIDSFSWNGRVFYSATSQAQLPTQFSNIQMIYGLENLSQQGSEALPLYRTLGTVTPDQTLGLNLYYSPSEIRQAYNATALLKAGYDGKGVSIAIVDAYGDPNIQQELRNFSAEFGLPLYNGTLHIIPVGPYNPQNGITYGWSLEVALDVEWAHAMAPNATINLYAAANSGNYLYDAVLNATLGYDGKATGVYHNSIISMSWGEPENDFGSSTLVDPVRGLNYPWLDQVFQIDAALGITAFAGSGDWGAYDQGQGHGQTSPYGGAIYPSTDPYVTAVGGTSLYMNTTSGYYQWPYANATGTYGNETAWSWNNYYLWGTGGGWSTSFGQPSWQTGLGTVDNGERGVPDVAWDADPLTGVLVSVFDSATNSYEYEVVGGTSVGAPCWAGAMALVDQKAGRSLGYINPAIYSILTNSSEYSKAFYDIRVGNNDPDSAANGWDPLTGVGSPNMGELADLLAPTGQLAVVATNDFSNMPSRAYAVGQAINLTAVVANNRTITGPVTATIASSTGATIASGIVLTYSARQGVWIGSYAIRPTDPPGEWSAAVTATNGSISGEGYTSFVVGDGVTISTPSSGWWYQVGNTISINSYVVDPSGNYVTQGTYTAAFYLAQNQTSGNILGKIEGKINLQYGPSKLWEGSLTLSNSVDQAAWIIVVNGTDLNGNKGTAYAWINVGLEGFFWGVPPSYVLGDEIPIIALIYYENGSMVQTSAFTALIYCGSTFLAKVPLTVSTMRFPPNYIPNLLFLWEGDFTTSSNSPTGFYTITVNGTDGEGNSCNFATVVRVAPYSLTVQVSVQSPTMPLQNGSEPWVLAKVTYPSGNPMTAGIVNGFLYNPGVEQMSQFIMTYNSSSEGFVATNFLIGINVTTSLLFGQPVTLQTGSYGLCVEAYDPLGNYGVGSTSFAITLTNHPAIDITRNADFTAANGVIRGTGSTGNPYLIDGWNVSSISITNVTSSYELLNDYVSGSAGNGITINTPKSSPKVIDVYTVQNEGNGLYANDSPAGLYFEVTAENNGKDGILIANDTLAENGAVDSCTVSNNALNGIVYESSSEPNVLNNIVWNPNRVGIDVTGQQGSWYGRAIIEDNGILNFARGNSTGIYVDGLGQNLTTAKLFGSPSYAEVYDNALSWNNIGICAVNNAVIDAEGNSIFGCNIGISTVNSLAYLTYNSVQSNSGNGIQIVGQSPFEAQKPPQFSFGQGFGTVAAYNTARNSGNAGISISNTNSALVANNSVGGNQGGGIELNNATGVSLQNPTTIVWENSVFNNTNSGIEANHVTYASIIGNSVAGNGQGIMLLSCSNNIILENDVTSNDQGIFLSSSSNNVIYHNNFVNNNDQVISDGSPNTWDNGYPSGGNYWSNYEAKCPNAEEIDNSGIWNMPYVIDSNNTDRYPFMKTWIGYSVTFYLQGVSSDSKGTAVTIDGTNYTAANLPMSFLWTRGSVHTFSFASAIAVLNGTMQYAWNSTIGLSTAQSAPLDTTSSGNVIGNYTIQYRAMFSQTGVGSDYNGPVVIIDGTYYASTALPITLWWGKGGFHSYSFLSPLAVGSTKRYVWNSASGWPYQQYMWSSPLTGHSVFAAPVEVVGNYVLQYAAGFAQSGVGSDFNGTVLAVDGIQYAVSQMPLLFYWPVNSTHTFAYESPLTVSTNATRYAWTKTTGLLTLQNGTITIAGYGSVTGNYETQYYLTVNSVYGTPSGMGWYGSESTAIATLANGTVSGGAGVRYVFTGWSGDASGTGLASNPITMSEPQTATVDWKTQYYLTVKTVPTGITTITGQGWYNASSTALLTAPSVVLRLFLGWDIDGVFRSLVNPVTVQMNAPHTVTAYYCTRPRARALNLREN